MQTTRAPPQRKKGMTQVVGGLYDATRRLINRVHAADEKEVEEFYRVEVPDEESVEAQFTEDIEIHIRDTTNFLQSPDQPSVLNWVLQEFPKSLTEDTGGRTVVIPIKMTNGTVEESLERVLPEETAVTVCHVELGITQLNQSARVKAVIGKLVTDLGVMVRMGPQGFESSRPLLTTSGKSMDSFLAGHTWTRPLVDETCEPEDDMVFWHRDLRGLLTLIDCAHISPYEQRWGIYRCILDHCASHYLLPTELSDKLIKWHEVKYAPINLNTDLSLTTKEKELNLEGSLFVVYFGGKPTHPQYTQTEETTYVDVGEV